MLQKQKQKVVEDKTFGMKNKKVRGLGLEIWLTLFHSVMHDTVFYVSYLHQCFGSQATSGAATCWMSRVAGSRP